MRLQRYSSLLLYGLLGLIHVPVHGQVATDYAFTSSSGTYSAISGGTQLWGGPLQFGSIDDDISAAQSIPAFNYAGVAYTQMFVSANGFITVGAAPAGNNYIPLSSTAPYAGAIAAFGTDLQHTNAGFGFTQREVRWQTVGNEIIVQWKGMRRKGVSNEILNFQIRLNTATSQIRIVYGGLSGQGSALTFQPEVGLRGPNNTFATNVNNRLVGTGTENWPTSLAGTANNSTMRFTTTAPAKAYTNGLTYLWGPNCTQPSVTVSIGSDCAPSSYSLVVKVNSLGSAPHVDLISSVGGLFANDVGVGSYSPPTVPLGTAVVITVVHNGNAFCNASFGPFVSGVCQTPSLTIPDNACGTSSLDVAIPISHPGTVLGTDVVLRSVDLILETILFNQDIEVRLISPTGQIRNLMLDRFGSGTNIGNPTTCPNTVLRLIDGGAPLSNTTTSNVTGSYAPEQSLSGFTGDPNGVWTLRICDDAFSLFLTCSLKYAMLNFATAGASNACAARPILCGETISAGSTAGYPNTLPGGACQFNGAASSGGVHWWTYTATSSDDAIVSTCGNSSFDSRISVFHASPTCTDLVCVGMNDDTPGCLMGSSEVRFANVPGETYLIAVHGPGASGGDYCLTLVCVPICAPAVANDQCGSAEVLVSVLADGSGTPSTEDNGCSYVDAPPSCAGTGPVLGVWYAFNSGAYTRYRLTLADNGIDPGYTATTLSYAVYDGTCAGLGASGELGCVTSGAGTTELPQVATNTDVHLLVHNPGGIGVAGTFGLLLEHPGINDAGIVSVTSPTGLVCGTLVAPVAILKNHGEAQLASVIIDVSIDGGPPILSYNWSDAPLPYLSTTTVTLPFITVPSGAHTMTLTAHTPNGSVDEISQNSAASTAYNASGQAIKVHIISDNDGAETTWEIYDMFSVLLASGGPYANNADVVTTLCLPTANGNIFNFYLYDGAGDGMCCANGNGSWELLDAQDRVLLRDGGEFTTQSPPVIPASSDYVGHLVGLPPGPAAPLPNECGVFTNNLLNKVYCNQVPGVTAYQFHFSDPDAGFHRRIVVPRRWVSFSEIQTNPLTPGVIYFCRARVDQGSPGFSDDRYGPGCEMAIDPDQVPGCTELIAMGDPDFPSNTWSCGAIRSFGGSDKIWAYPIINGTQYRFQFENVGEGYLRNILRPNYVCILNWVTLPLVNGSTYTVRVEVRVNNVWSGFCGGDCTLTIQNPPMAGGGLNSATEAPDVLSMWPNPNHGDRLYLELNEVEAGITQVKLDLHDLSGHHLFGRVIPADGPFTTVLDLSDQLAKGSYILTVTAGEKTYPERLIIE